MEPIDIDALHEIDPKPFYRAVLSDPTEGGQQIDLHPIEHRYGLLWNAAFRSVRHWFQYRRPGNRPRNGLLALYAAEVEAFESKHGFDPLPMVVLYLQGTFEPDKALRAIAEAPAEVCGEVGLLVPSVIGNHYPWRQGEREALVVSMSLFDHTIGRAPTKGERS